MQESPPSALQYRRPLSARPCGQTWPVPLPAQPWTTPDDGEAVNAARGRFSASTRTVRRVRDALRRWE